MTVDVVRHSAEMDCRGAGVGVALSEVNKVLITKAYYSGEVEPGVVEVSCFYVRRGGKKCLVNGTFCPHLRPVSSAS